MFELALEILELSLSIWKDERANKYVNEIVDLRTRWRDEYNKPRGERSNAVLDNCESELRIIADRVRSEIGASNAGAKP